MNFKAYLQEKYLTMLKANYNRVATEIFENPSKKEAKEIERYNEYNAWLVGDKMIAWSGLLHATVMDSLKLGRNAIPIQVYGNQTEAEIVVSDTSTRTKWHHSSKVANEIMNHPHLNKLYIYISVSYYDEAIVGDWERYKK